MTLSNLAWTIGFIAFIIFVIWFDNQWEVKPMDIHQPELKTSVE